jgi:hypothetical protein
MANPLRGEAEIEGTKYTLVYDMNTLCEAEDVLGVKIPALTVSLAEGDVGFKTIRGLVWAGLQEKHECSVREAGTIISDAGMDPVMAAVQKALTAAFPSAGEGVNPPKGTRRRTG